MAYYFGLLGFTLVKVLAPGYFARQDTKTPVRIGIIALITNMALNVAIVIPWYQSGASGAHAGLALATSLSAFLNAALLYRGLRKEGVLQRSEGLGWFVLRVVLACAVMTMLLNYFVPGQALWLDAGLWQKCLWLIGAVIGGVATYIATLFATGIRPADLRMKPPVPLVSTEPGPGGD
jgi:putative peptidoglycan lipid II flippase